MGSSWMGFDGCEVGIDAVMVLMILSSNSEHKKGQFGKENGLCREGCWVYMLPVKASFRIQDESHVEGGPFPTALLEGSWRWPFICLQLDS